MLTKITIENFKSFQKVEVPLGPFTVLMGTNASGKSNIRDAFRFLHGVSRGYTLAEILGEKWVEGGVQQWRGIRGGTRETTYMGVDSFSISVSFNMNIFRRTKGKKEKVLITPAIKKGRYRIQVELNPSGQAPRVVAEELCFEGMGDYLIHSNPPKNAPKQKDDKHISVRVRKKTGPKGPDPRFEFLGNQPVLTQVLTDIENKVNKTVISFVKRTLLEFESMRFLDLNPDAMRIPSLPGQTILGDRGENLSSVLFEIYNDENTRDILMQWIQELTPMDVVNFSFPSDPAGRILLTLHEKNKNISAYSASDGTLRFLALIAALLGPKPARVYFFEELENGIHPTRLHLLLQLIEQKVVEGHIQVIATTHSPQLLSLLNEDSINHASLVYRLAESEDSRVKRIVDIPDAKALIEQQSFARLHSTGWFEDVMSFIEDEENEE